MTAVSLDQFLSRYQSAVQNEAAPLESLDSLFKETVLSQHTYTSRQRSLLESKWEQIRHLGCQNAGLDSWGAHFSSIDVRQVERVHQAFCRVVAAVEAEPLMPFPEVRTPLQEKMRRFFEDVEVPSISWISLSFREISALYLAHDSELMRELHNEIHMMFARILEQIQAGNHELKSIELVVAHLIGMIPFFTPPDGFEAELLQRIGNDWRLVRYRFSRVELPTPIPTSPMVAYGLIPIDDEQAPPLFLFHGTPPPTISGALLSYMADYTPFFNVGDLIYDPAKEVISQWIGAQNQTVHVYGISLGGSLAYHVGRDFGDRVYLHTCVPPGFFWTAGTETIHGETFCHEKDPISLLAFHPESPDFEFYRTFTERPRSVLTAHARASGGFVPTVIVRVEVSHENARFARKAMILLHQLCAIPLTLFSWAYIAFKWTVLAIYNMVISALSYLFSQQAEEQPERLV